jgi:hypothetical protein
MVHTIFIQNNFPPGACSARYAQKYIQDLTAMWAPKWFKVNENESW